MFFRCDKFLNSRLCIFKKVLVLFILSVFTFFSHGNGGNRCAQELRGITTVLDTQVAETVSQIERLANQGDVAAQRDLGKLYYTGVGVVGGKRDYKKAFHWLKKVAEQGDAEAQGIIGWLYFRGKGVIIDHERALYWLEKSANQGNLRAQYRLVGVYYQLENYIQAYKWFSLLRRNGMLDDYTERLFNSLERKLTENQIAEAQKLADEFQIQQ